MGVPRSPSAGREVDRADVELRVALGLDDRIDPHVAGEPLGWTLDSRRVRLDSHCSSCCCRWSALGGVMVCPRGCWRGSPTGEQVERLLRAAPGFGAVNEDALS